MFPCICSVIDHRRRQNAVRTSATLLFLPHFDVICDLLLNRSFNARKHGIYLLNIVCKYTTKYTFSVLIILSILYLFFYTNFILKSSFKMKTILFLLQGHLSEGTKVLFDYLHKEPKMTMILGPFDNDLAKTVAAYAGLPDIGLLQVRISLCVRINVFPEASLGSLGTSNLASGTTGNK